MKIFYEAQIQNALYRPEELEKRRRREYIVNKLGRGIGKAARGAAVAIPGAALGYGLSSLTNKLEKRKIIKRIRELSEELEYTQREDVRENLINTINNLKQRLDNFSEHSKSVNRQGMAIGGLYGGVVGSGIHKDILNKVFNRR